jgi:hypothetical protein
MTRGIITEVLIMTTVIITRGIITEVLIMTTVIITRGIITEVLIMTTAVIILSIVIDITVIPATDIKIDNCMLLSQPFNSDPPVKVRWPKLPASRYEHSGNFTVL